MEGLASIIAEFCQNHNGDLSVLKDMIWTAAAEGADFAKLQSMLVDELTYRERFENGLIENDIVRAIKRPFRPEYDRLKSLILDDDAHCWFIEECHRAGIKPLTTVFTRDRVRFLKTLEWAGIKVASYDCGSFPLLRDLVDHFKHLYVSTGATYDHEISTAAAILAGRSFTFLHCVSIYPTPLHKLHLSRMKWLRQFTQSVGFSDHSLIARDGIRASLAALALGADVIERHFTILQPDATKDGPVSINRAQLRELAEFARQPAGEVLAHVREHVPDLEDMMGTDIRALSREEELNRDYYRGRFASRVGDGHLYNWEEV